MKISDYRNVHGVKDTNLWITKSSRVEKAHEDEFEKELEDSIYKRKSETKNKKKKTLTSNEHLIEMGLEVDYLFPEYEQKGKLKTDTDPDEEPLNTGNRFSSWG